MILGTVRPQVRVLMAVDYLEMKGLVNHKKANLLLYKTCRDLRLKNYSKEVERRRTICQSFQKNTV